MIIGSLAHAAAKFAFVAKEYEGEGNYETATIKALTLLLHSSAVAFVRYTYWVPKDSVTDAAGVPPKLNNAVKVAVMCV